MEKALLSKSTFIRGLQCKKSLFLYKNHYQLRDELSAVQKAVFSRGHAVGSLAHRLFPGGIDASSTDKYNYNQSVPKTQALINSGAEIIYEASFQFNGVYAAIDMLVKQNGSWVGYEVKSSAKITATYLMDAALQYFVIAHSGIDLIDFKILYVNTDYIFENELEPENFFRQQSVLKEIVDRQDIVKTNINELKLILSETHTPNISIGEHCHSPYNCDFMGTCRGAIADDSIFHLAGSNKKTQYELFLSGIKKLQDLPNDFPFTKEQKIQFDCALHNNEHIEKLAINKFLEKLVYPICFLDFEISMPAIPQYKGTSPFEHIPFLYSLHIQNSESSEPIHRYFIADRNQHPFKAFVQSLLSDIAQKGSVLIFDSTHELRILNKAANDFPEFRDDINQVKNRIVDFSIPFQKKYFYSSKMKGSYGMKQLLTAFFEDWSFQKLPIQNGIAAVAAFETLQNSDDLFLQAELRGNLIDYCKADTLGMVKLLQLLVIKSAQ